MAKSNADRQREYKARQRGNGTATAGNETVTPVTESPAEGNETGNETPDKVTLDMAALVEDWAGDNCQCGHYCNARRHEHKRRLNQDRKSVV